MSRSKRLKTAENDGKGGLELNVVNPLTQNQHRSFGEWYRDRNIAMLGCPGTGKTFLALYLALKAVADKEQRKVVIFRSNVSGRDIGHLPGGDKEKMSVYESPYTVNCTKLYGRADAYQILKQKGIIEFESTSFQRGNTIDDAVIIIDECQNMNFQELHTLATRVGDNTRIIVVGDKDQQDLTKEREMAGVDRFLRILRGIPEFSFVNFGVDDIVRSGFVKDYMIQYMKVTSPSSSKTPALA